MYMVQYILPCVIELSYIYSLQKGSAVQGFKQKYSLTVAAAIIIIFISFRGILFTAMFFHTTSENFFALTIVFLLAYLPIHYSTYFPFLVNEIFSKGDEKKSC